MVSMVCIDEREWHLPAAATAVAELELQHCIGSAAAAELAGTTAALTAGLGRSPSV
jgi:hypothetical protein